MTYPKWQYFYHQTIHTNQKVLESLNSPTTARGIALVTSKGLRQLNKKSKLTTLYTTKKEKQMNKTIN